MRISVTYDVQDMLNWFMVPDNGGEPSFKLTRRPSSSRCERGELFSPHQRRNDFSTPFGISRASPKAHLPACGVSVPSIHSLWPSTRSRDGRIGGAGSSWARELFILEGVFVVLAFLWLLYLVGSHLVSYHLAFSVRVARKGSKNSTGPQSERDLFLLLS